MICPPLGERTIMSVNFILFRSADNRSGAHPRHVNRPPPPSNNAPVMEVTVLPPEIQNIAFRQKNGIQSEKKPTTNFSNLSFWGSPLNLRDPRATDSARALSAPLKLGYVPRSKRTQGCGWWTACILKPGLQIKVQGQILTLATISLLKELVKPTF